MSPRWRPVTEGWWLILPVAAAGLVLLRRVPRLALLALGAAAGLALFYRDPERRVRAHPALALAPADGRVIHVDRVYDPFWDTELIEVAIFLSIFDVHIQRSPVDGIVLAQQCRTGGYHPAMTRQATHSNNQVATHIETAAGPCTVTQISGLAARRIVTWKGPDDRIAQGERLGMIKFGSQVTLRLPLSATTLVKPGDRVFAGITPVARVDSKPAS